MEATFSSMGIADGIQVVAYDDAGGGIAARLWWMLHFLGHDAVAVLDGGWPHWIRAGLPTRSGGERNPPRPFSAQPRSEWVVNADQVDGVRTREDWRVIDARAPERFRGDMEPIDPVAGHIPGAVSAPYSENLDTHGTFLQPEDLRRHFENVLGDTAGDCVVSYCGSGVTAAHNLLALVHAGLGHGRLYPGSWSEWITDPKRPVEKDGTHSLGSAIPP
jgi:thiosulfate/3-mercaptopyruvate sulfurtransferase